MPEANPLILHGACAAAVRGMHGTLIPHARHARPCAAVRGIVERLARHARLCAAECSGVRGVRGIV